MVTSTPPNTGQTIDTTTLSEAINGSCSVRAYAPEKIDQSTLQELLAAAVRAPTAMHTEPWQFVIIQDTSRLKRLSDRVKAALATDATHLHPDHSNRDIFSCLLYTSPSPRDRQ